MWAVTVIAGVVCAGIARNPGDVEWVDREGRLLPVTEMPGGEACVPHDLDNPPGMHADVVYHVGVRVDGDGRARFTAPDRGGRDERERAVVVLLDTAVAVDGEHVEGGRWLPAAGSPESLLLSGEPDLVTAVEAGGEVRVTVLRDGDAVALVAPDGAVRLVVWHAGRRFVRAGSRADYEAAAEARRLARRGERRETRGHAHA